MITSTTLFNKPLHTIYIIRVRVDGGLGELNHAPWLIFNPCAFYILSGAQGVNEASPIPVSGHKQFFAIKHKTLHFYLKIQKFSPRRGHSPCSFQSTRNMYIIPNIECLCDK